MDVMSDLDRKPRAATLLSAAVVIAALGYFADVVSLVLFSIVRQTSLEGLGVVGEANFSASVLLLDAQLGGMFVGGIVWGSLGDRMGRLRALSLSIVVYSLANVANAFVHGVSAYAACRAIAGFGLAGDLGLGITLVSERLSAERRGLGTMLVSMIGTCGAFLAVGITRVVDWRTAYVIGGVLGLLPLMLRMGVSESNAFERARVSRAARGDLRLFFRDRRRCMSVLSLVLIGAPIWFVVGILVTFAPEFAKGFDARSTITGGDAVFWCYIGAIPGDLTSGLLSQKVRSRKRAIFVFLVLEALAIAVFLAFRSHDARWFLAIMAFAGFSTGYWAVVMTMVAEQFGTNLRATAATIVPNLVRASAVVLALIFGLLKGHIGLIASAWFVGAIIMVVAFAALTGQTETFGRQLDFTET